MKLYELAQGDHFKLAGDDNSPIYRFYKVDGMYSICYNKHGKIVHLAAYAPVLLVKGGFDEGS